VFYLAVIVTNIRAGLERSEDDVIEKALSHVKKTRNDLKNAYIIKVSVDARHKNNLCLVYSVGLEFSCDEEKIVAEAKDKSVTLHKKTVYEPPIGTKKLENRPVIVGFGPAGMFAGLLLAEKGYRPIIAERGEAVEQRIGAVEKFFKTGVLDTHSNVQFGEGGAGTFSDGKLTTRIGDPRCEMIIDEFVKFGAPQSIKRLAKPHIGTDNLRMVVKNIRNRIISLGGEIHFNTTLTGIGIKNGKVKSVFLNGEEVPAQAVILAIGHSARDTFSTLLETGVVLVPKPFSVGVRVEHLQSEIDKALYGKLAGHPALPHGAYALSYREGGRAVYTFCMCPGGSVVAAASEEGSVVTNGMSYYKRDGKNANSALVVSVSPQDFGSHPLDGVKFQRQLEAAAFDRGGKNYFAPCQTVGDFLNGTNGFHPGRVVPSYPIGVCACDIGGLFPNYITAMLKKGLLVFDKKLSGFAAGDTVMTGVETRTSSPVRIERGGSFEAVGINGLYPAGEGAGYAGGIMSAAADGLRVAEAIMSEYAPLK
jgi:uncharacterized FAD-dependent dehydrogenase